MARLRWTPQALDDVEAICKFLVRDSDYYAHLFANKVFEKSETIEKFPYSGRIVPELEKDTIRELIYGNYRIIYLIVSHEIQVLTVHHSSRLLDIGKLG
jgi:toxin ParE1/3/4